MTARCVATNGAGVRCLWTDHEGDYHMYADDRDRYAYHYGSLAYAVEAFLAGRLGADRDFLARTLAAAEAAIAETAVSA